MVICIDSADLGRPSESMIDRRLRLASSSPDVKALFNGTPSYIYHVEEEEDYESNYVPGPSTESYWTPLPPIVSLNFSSPSAIPANSLSSQGSGIPARTRQSDDNLKRGSDSLLEAKLKDSLSAKPRSLTNRAQSLDLTFSLSRITEAAGLRSELSRPDSPANSIGETGSSSPTAPSFPNVYGPPRSARSPVIGTQNIHGYPRGGPVMEDDGVDEVSRVISNLGL